MASARHSGIRLAIVLTAIAVGSYVAWHYTTANKPADARAGISATPGSGVRLAPIPVTIASGQPADFPVYLNGLGTVQPYRTVTVRSRVDGQIIKVDFRQGRMVHEGDVLVQIDPRPYRAALDQALAKKTQDEANLANAKRDLDRYISLKEAASRQQVDTQQAMVDQLTAQVAGDQAAIENAQTQVDYTTIKAPLSGRAGFRTVDPGNIVHASDQTGIVPFPSRKNVCFAEKFVQFRKHRMIVRDDLGIELGQSLFDLSGSQFHNALRLSASWDRGAAVRSVAGQFF